MNYRFLYLSVGLLASTNALVSMDKSPNDNKITFIENEEIIEITADLQKLGTHNHLSGETAPLTRDERNRNSLVSRKPRNSSVSSKKRKKDTSPKLARTKKKKNNLPLPDFSFENNNNNDDNDNNIHSQNLYEARTKKKKNNLPKASLPKPVFDNNVEEYNDNDDIKFSNMLFLQRENEQRRPQVPAGLGRARLILQWEAVQNQP